MLVSYSADGEVLVTASDDKQVRLYTAADGVNHRSLYIGYTATALSVFPEGERVMTASANTVQVWNMTTKEVMWSIPDIENCITVGSDDGLFIATAPQTATQNGELRVWSVTATGIVLVKKISMDAAVTSMSWSDDSTRIAVAVKNYLPYPGVFPVVEVLDVLTGALIGLVAPKTYPSPGETLPLITSVAFSRNNTIVHAAEDGTVVLSYADTLRQISNFTLPSPVTSVSFGPNGTNTLCTTATQGAYIVIPPSAGAPSPGPPSEKCANELNGDCVMRFEAGTEPGQSAYSPAGGQLAFAVGGNSYATRVYSSETGTLEYALWATQPTVTVSYSKSGAVLATGSKDFVVRVYRADGGDYISAFSVGYTPDTCAVFPNEEVVLTATASSNIVSLWSVSNGTEITQIPMGYSGVLASVSHDGMHILTGPNQGPGQVQVWMFDGTFPAVKHALQVPNKVSALEWAVDGERVVLALSGNDTTKPSVMALSEDLETKWKVESDAEVNAVSFSKDGPVGTGAADGTVAVWSTSGDAMVTYKLPSAVTSLSFAPNGADILATTKSNGLYVLSCSGCAPSSSSSDTALIVAVVCSVLGVVLVAGIVYTCSKRRNRSEESAKLTQVNVNSDGSPSSPPPGGEYHESLAE
eukprot:TRINITY_DN35848_c0_g1_i1.p1 TRINITY_DN35848_c0_g1~~TRINITY_DN35848_c0_g1_i1.p1  ORF type:complete len:729 (+),score=260.25 TRINITY_DN35848_c0_g1_i1:269-2188(+)